MTDAMYFEPAVAPKVDVLGAVVKSAGRALQILEFFDEVQREACVTEISRALRYPQSSTSVLLRSLVLMGYLQHDRYQRTYFPTRRVSLLGSWVDPSLLQQGTLMERAEWLARQSQQTVVMATANGLFAQYIYIHRNMPERQDGDALSIGSLRPIATTAVGKALMSTFDDNHVGKLVRRINAERAGQDAAISISDFLVELKIGRKRGYFVGAGADSGQGGLATTVDRSKQLLVIGIEGDSRHFEEAEQQLVDMLKSKPA